MSEGLLDLVYTVYGQPTVEWERLVVLSRVVLDSRVSVDA
jgi:hypothetical protein